MSKYKKIILSALLLALLIVLSRFISIKTQLLVISVSFIPIIISAIWLGPKYSILIAGLGDFIRSIVISIWYVFPRFYIKCYDFRWNLWNDFI